jgi:lipopolysaccharide/colanic/teichoic acid biosynthesis glycosyltransferase
MLTGEMSAVGPRAERPEFVDELAKEIPLYQLRHAVKPGMAGLSLVKQGYTASKEDACVKLEYDFYYLPDIARRSVEAGGYQAPIPVA